MSLPKDFESSEEYFTECLKFFEDYQYLYNTSNVEILLHNVLDKIDLNAGDIDVFDDNIDLAAISDDYLIKFFSKLKKLQVFHKDFLQDEVEYNINVPLSIKKKHEIMYLAKEINEICGNNNCDVIVDFGSGLGYLDQLLFETTNYKVLGIECNENHYVGAKKRQRKYHENSLQNVKYVKHTIKGDSHEKINFFLTEKFQNLDKFCITGLHACADLTIDAINIFFEMEKAKAIAIMPCCYHKMIETNGHFKNFPISSTLKNVYERWEGDVKMNVPFLRLAAQPPRVEEKLQDLVFNLLSRAVLQVYASKHNYKLKRNRRKPVKTKTMDNNFDQYVQNSIESGFTLTPTVPLSEDQENPSFNVEDLKSMWANISSVTFKKAAIYILLQNHLQPVMENFVLYDRLVYLKENGVNNCSFKKILNEKISPRCLALVAYKS
ncbi:unnamed protein product [Arctia plantaginis]|uniref:Methyltransferase domain-containing protein n=1 Tax=Arctia plantaginis TaxID=874455 RepID=A0A8S0YTI4_ARCPL|nr:unnamed protein product [Arctia plantaginis]